MPVHPPDTWSGVLFSGLIGSLIGSAATVLVVVLTIRNQAGVREEERLHEAVAEAYSSAQSLSLDIAARGQPPAVDVFKPALTAMATAITRAQRSEPFLARYLIDAAQDLTESTNAAYAGGATPSPEILNEPWQRVTVALWVWTISPRTIQFGLWSYADVEPFSAQALPGGWIPTGSGIPVPGQLMRLKRWVHWPGTHKPG